MPPRPHITLGERALKPWWLIAAIPLAFLLLAWQVRAYQAGYLEQVDARRQAVVAQQQVAACGPNVVAAKQ